VLASLFLVVALATLAMPGSANFVGEFLILLGLFETKLAMAVIAFTGVALASVYMLRMYIRAMHNRPRPEATASRDLTLGDALVIVPLTLAIIAFALYPQGALRDSEPVVKATIQEVVR
jgi:NADH-quinone oxidoreductase subunit M